MRIKRIMCVFLAVLCLTVTACGSQGAQKDATKENAKKQEVIMYDEYQDVPDFGKTYGIESNTEKEQVMESVVKNGFVKVYDIPEKEKSNVNSWCKELEKNGFELVDQENTDDGKVMTYENAKNDESIVVTFAKSTVENEGYVFIIAAKEDESLGLPTADDPNITSIIQKQNYLQGDGWYLLQDNWLYGLTWRDDGSGYFAKRRMDGTDYTKLLDVTVMDPVIDNGYIYGANDEGTNQGIYKVRTSGEDATLIVSANEPTMQLESGYIYYSTDKYNEDPSQTDKCHLYRCSLDGSNIEEVISKPVFCWFVFGELVLYQDDIDNQSLHLYNMATKEDEKLNDQISYAPIYDGNYIYYASLKDRQENEGSGIWRMNIDGSENQEIGSFYINDRVVLYNDYIYFSNMADNFRIYRINKDGSNLTQITQDSYCGYLYFAGDKLFYVSYSGLSDDDYIDKAVMCNPDGSGAANIQLNQ